MTSRSHTNEPAAKRTRRRAAPPIRAEVPAAALEDLYRKLIRLDATADACRTAFDEMPYLEDPEARRICARCYVLIDVMADEARKAVLEGERYVFETSRQVA